MKKIILLLLLVNAYTGYAQITVATYNIRNSRARDGVNSWQKRKATLAALVTKINPDILGMQAVRNDQLKYLSTTLNQYQAFGVGRDNGKHGGEHSPVLFRKDKFELITGGNFWLSQTPNIPGSKSWDAAITRICSWVKLKDRTTGEELFVFNTHFDHKGKEARRQSAALLRHTIDSLAGSLPVIAMGDFNFTPEDSAYTTMSTGSGNKVRLNDSYAIGGPAFTDCGFAISNINCHRIDYIWYSPHFDKSNYKVWLDNNGQYYPSDHLPVSVVLTIR